jgi:hypothetical protein
VLAVDDRYLAVDQREMADDRLADGGRAGERGQRSEVREVSM